MKHRAELVIDAPREFVFRLFDDPQQRRNWQPTLESIEQRSGSPGRPGAVAEFVYAENGRRLVMQETVMERREPDFIAVNYTSSFGSTQVVNTFEALDDERTKICVWCNFRFRGAMKLKSLFTGRSIRRRTDTDLERFKLFAETAAASR